MPESVIPTEVELPVTPEKDCRITSHSCPAKRLRYNYSNLNQNFSCNCKFPGFCGSKLSLRLLPMLGFFSLFFLGTVIVFPSVGGKEKM